MRKKLLHRTGYLTQRKTHLGILLVVLLWIGFSACQPEPTLFRRLDSVHTGIDFRNEIKEDETHNILNFTNLYTGSGVGIADINRDGLPDIFFGGNMESSRLYLNQGGLKFEDITKSAGLKTDRWITGVAVVDINDDGWEDFYLSVSGKATSEDRKNLLFINQQDNSFKEEAERYGIADTSQCTHANFLDYDKDGDLDLFLLVNPTDYKLYNVNNIRAKRLNGEARSTDKLYRNEGNGYFKNVSREAGILIEGYSLGVNTSDINGDSWPDIYVSNDFLTNDILYINNQDGTFTNRAAEMLKHTSFASMGVDVADINNDGLPEIYVLDMFPEDNYRQKMIMGGDNYTRFQYILKAGYEPQFSRNTLQLNNGDQSFSEIGQLANVHKTDWSWSPLFADYDNDGFRDLFVTNGFRRDLGDLDYISYNQVNPFGNPASRKKDQLARIVNQPGAKLDNYFFKNEGGIHFSKKSKNWGVDIPSYSHGASFADLDLDGDVDLIVNNVSQEAFIYENQGEQLLSNNYLKIDLSRGAETIALAGTKVWIYDEGQMQYAEYNRYRGYQSSVTPVLHFGLGNASEIDSVIVQWTNGNWDKWEKQTANQTLKLEPTSSSVSVKKRAENPPNKLFNSFQLLDYQHKEDLQVDFDSQSLLPHQHSQSGPPIARGDINQDGLDDFYVGGAAGESGVFFIQKKDGGFIQRLLSQDEKNEDTDALFLDIEGDGDLDLYVASGGVMYSRDTLIYQDRLYKNEGGIFTKELLPYMPESTGAIAAADYDKDGDVDLFVGGRLRPQNYPQIPSSYVLENQGGTFINKTPAHISRVGMVSSAIWTDMDADQDLDLMLAGEFMPLLFFENKEGELSDKAIEIAHSKGWWNTLSAGDFDEDGDIDFLAGNLGLNTNYRASETEPLCLYAHDFDENGSLDPILTQFIQGIEYPIPSRDKLMMQIPALKTRFDTYKKYAEASFSDLFKEPEKTGMQVLEAYQLQSMYVENLGNGSFSLRELPMELQMAPIQGFWVEDLDEDGHLDVLAIGNSYATEVSMGQYDAFTGAVLMGNGQGDFTVMRGAESGFLANKDARSLSKIRDAEGKQIYVVANNQEFLQFFKKAEALN